MREDWLLWKVQLCDLKPHSTLKFALSCEKKNYENSYYERKRDLSLKYWDWTHRNMMRMEGQNLRSKLYLREIFVVDAFGTQVLMAISPVHRLHAFHWIERGLNGQEMDGSYRWDVHQFSVVNRLSMIFLLSQIKTTCKELEKLITGSNGFYWPSQSFSLPFPTLFICSPPSLTLTHNTWTTF